MEDTLNKRLVINSIFNSINGEVNRYGQGSFSTFIRLQGCNLRCKYCDTAYAQGQFGIPMTVQKIVDKVITIGCNTITITGGEPLIQDNLRYLIYELGNMNRINIIVETNGTIKIPTYLLYNVGCWVMDFKLPSSGQNGDIFEYYNCRKLRPIDYIKFVISDEEDYRIAKETVKDLISYKCVAIFAFSCNSAGELTVTELIAKMKEDKLFNIMLNTQLHKLLSLKE